jgi:hypothetical protein
MTRRVTAIVVSLQAAGAVAPAAQSVTVAPSFGTSVVYDDNLYHQPVAEGDLRTRFSPRIDVVRQSEKLTVSSRFALDADRFTQHPELTTATARQDATVDARYTASRRLSFTAAASFTETETPADLNEVTALTPGRARARRMTVHPSTTYDIGARDAVRVGYIVSSDSLQGGVGATAQTATASVERHLSARSTLTVEYLEQHFLFGGGSDASASRAITTEWTRELARGTTLMLRAGPRVTRGMPAPELAATARHQQRAGSLSLSYQQTQTTLIGLEGIADVRGLAATAERELSPRLRILTSTGVLQTRQAHGASLTYRVSGVCTWTLAHGIAVEAGYDADRQRGNLYTAQPAQNINGNRATVALTVAPVASTGSRR